MTFFPSWKKEIIRAKKTLFRVSSNDLFPKLLDETLVDMCSSRERRKVIVHIEIIPLSPLPALLLMWLGFNQKYALTRLSLNKFNEDINFQFVRITPEEENWQF